MKNIYIKILLISLFFSPFVAAEGLLDKLNNIVTTTPAEDEILDPDVAFRVIADIEADRVRLDWQIEPGYYLYKNRFKANVLNTALPLEDMQLPKGKEKNDPAFGEVEVYYDQLTAYLAYTLTAQSESEIELEVTYQGCKEDSVCYPPVQKVFNLQLPENVNAGDASTAIQSNNVPQQSAQDTITNDLKSKSILLNIMTFLGFGLLLSLTPCVFPMIPILSGILVGEKNITRKKGFMISLSYVLAMALTYSVLGVIAASINLNLQIASQQPWLIAIFSFVFVMLALSMFGFYDIQLPSSWQTKLNASSSNNSGSLKGAAIMGVVSAVIVGPCVAPPLAGALLYISQTGDVVLGGLALFAMGLGFGVPLLVIGALGGEYLPKAGTWMNTIKHIFGVLLIGVAIWFLDRILPNSISLLLWASLLIASAVFIGVFEQAESAWKKLCKVLGILFLVYGILILIGAASGANSVLKPLANLNTGKAVSQQSLAFVKVKSMQEIQSKIAAANAEGKTVMLDYYADWCVVCNELEAFTFPDTAVQAALSDVVLLKADVTANNADDKAMLANYSLFGPPAILFFDKQGNESKAHRLIGFINASDFIKHINDLKQQTL